MSKLASRTALITGAGRGIGRAVALAFAREGASVALTARTGTELEEVAAAVTALGGKALPLVVDLTGKDAPPQVLRQTMEGLGRIDILVNNAGIGSSACPRPVVDYDDDFWELSLRLNLTVPYRLCKGVLPQMLERGWGRIINMASINSKVASIHGAAYAASKHGLLGLTRTLALEVAGTGVTVNAICPGPVVSRMSDLRVEYDATRRGVDVADHEKTLTPLGRRLTPKEVAPLAVYFASDDAAAVTGQGWNVDGGLVMF